ncbi:alpha/beta hydrolase family protein [Kribbella catacumbae]|uniref:alpha/beta hydrolase family protein n=1 Tax=Kribbella catacumbae TaxID=460086 RepID=UPI00037356A1|nr:alpha/beta fold hydrolase [Kribbella catacumbae]
MIQEQCHRVGVGDDELAVVVATPPTGSPQRMVMMLHGGPGGQKDGPADLYVDLAAHLCSAGIASVRFDFRGCGESTGSYRDMTIVRQVEDLRAVRRFVDDGYQPSVWGLIGESFGAAVGLAGFDPAYRAVVLLWPAIWLLDGAFESYLSEENVSAARRDGQVDLDGEQIGLAFLDELREVQDVSVPLRGLSTPVLFVHGEADIEVPFGQSVRAANLLSGPHKLVGVPDGDHCLEEPQEREVVYRETVTWLHDHL